MPELPEVETTKSGIAPLLTQQTCLYTIVRQPKLRFPVSVEIIALKNSVITHIQRRAKYLILSVEQGGVIIIHLGMSGHLRLLPANTPAGKHDHIDLILGNQTMLRYTDPRRFGCWLWSDAIESHFLLRHLGVEPLSTDFNSHYLFQQTRNRRCSIKSWLMNSRYVVGIGNIYANEALFDTAILPQRLAHSLSKSECETLVESIKDILAAAIMQGGTTLRDFSQVNGNPGYFTQQLKIYGRANSPCYRCGQLVIRVQQQQRSTFYCNHCQK